MSPTLVESPAPTPSPTSLSPQAADVLAVLERDGIVVIPGFVGGETLRGMQQAFATMLRRMRWNHFEGYQRTERYRHMVEDVLMLDQGFVDVALHPLVKDVLDAYIGSEFQLAEAKGWKSLPTNEDFHGWHGDAWYDQAVVTDRIPREVKLAVYLTDVRSGAFHYLVGSHRKQHPAILSEAAVAQMGGHVRECLGTAGTAILFDTSGIHRQGSPMLEERQAIFLNYHDRAIPLQREDVAGYRYHPLLLNAAFLGGLSERDMRILGFGDKSNYLPHWSRAPRHERLQGAIQAGWAASLRMQRVTQRATGILRRLTGRRAT